MFDKRYQINSTNFKQTKLTAELANNQKKKRKQ